MLTLYQCKIEIEIEYFFFNLLVLLHAANSDASSGFNKRAKQLYEGVPTKQCIFS
jgi:hypothetical protein